MSIYIKGMEMPTSCYNCPCADLEFYDCNLMPGTRIERENRSPNCPLVPVPPHGDLIDRKPFVEFIKTHWDGYDQWFVGQLEARPTIIPADPAEEGET